jgi:hypothetical protein
VWASRLKLKGTRWLNYPASKAFSLGDYKNYFFDFRKTSTCPKSQRVAIFFSPSPQGEEDERIYEKNAEMEELDNVIISSTPSNYLR